MISKTTRIFLRLGTHDICWKKWENFWVIIGRKWAKIFVIQIYFLWVMIIHRQYIIGHSKNGPANVDLSVLDMDCLLHFFTCIDVAWQMKRKSLQNILLRPPAHPFSAILLYIWNWLKTHAVLSCSLPTPHMKWKAMLVRWLCWRILCMVMVV